MNEYARSILEKQREEQETTHLERRACLQRDLALLTPSVPTNGIAASQTSEDTDNATTLTSDAARREAAAERADA
jgi:hypothetical protein